MPIEQALADALEDLSLEPVEADNEIAEDSLGAGYSLPEVGASCGCCSPAACCCSCAW
jgi:hypothetical protein